jgi:hypothetical protein
MRIHQQRHVVSQRRAALQRQTITDVFCERDVARTSITAANFQW